MYGIALEYRPDQGGPGGHLLRATCRDTLVRQPGYRRRLTLIADGRQRVVDFFLFATPAAVTAALASDPWRTLAAAHPACRDAAPALLVSESPWGHPVVLLRAAPRPTHGGQACWRDQLTNVEPEATAW